MRREVAIFGALAPSLLLYFLAALALFVVMDRLLSRIGLYRCAWQPSLARCGLFLALLSGLVLFSGTP